MKRFLTLSDQDPDAILLYKALGIPATQNPDLSCSPFDDLGIDGVSPMLDRDMFNTVLLYNALLMGRAVMEIEDKDFQDYLSRVGTAEGRTEALHKMPDRHKTFVEGYLLVLEGEAELHEIAFTDSE